MSRHTLIIYGIAGLILSGCTGRSAVSEAELTDTVALEDVAIPDTFAGMPPLDSLATLSEEDVKSPIPTRAFTTEEEAIDFMKNSGHWDKYNGGIIMKIAGQDIGYANKLLANTFDYFIIVDKPSMNVILYDRYGREQKVYRMACSKKYGTKHKRRDNRTPEGFFSAEGIYNSTEWLYTDDDGKTSPKKGQFGPRFIRLKTDVTSQIGIHGTCAPWSLGHRASHGCIRIHNDAIMELVEYVTPGMPIIVNPSNRDQAVNINEGYDNITKLKLGKIKEKYVDPESVKEKEEKKETKTDTTAQTADSVPSQPAYEPAATTTETPDTISISDIMD